MEDLAKHDPAQNEVKTRLLGSYLMNKYEAAAQQLVLVPDALGLTGGLGVLGLQMAPALKGRTAGYHWRELL